MFKKTLICLALASTVGMTGCNTDGESGQNDNPDYKIDNPDFSGRTYPIFDPLAGDLPLPNDLIFDSEQGDGTFGVDDTKPPVTTALNELSGASTVAPTVIQFNGDIDPSTVITAKTVFLIELTYASGDPVQGLSNQEPPVPTAAIAAPSTLPDYRADVVQLDGNSAIRILPIEPLNPRKRYIAVVTNDVKDVNGDPIVQSPFYGSLTDEEQPLGSDKLAPVRALINNLWEPIAGAVGIPADKIAISYSFTTSNDEKVLQYIAEPAAWFADQIKTFVKVSAAKKATKATQNVEDPVARFTQISGAVGSAAASFPNIPVSETETLADKLDSIFASGPCGSSITGQDAINCAGTALASKFIDVLPTPISGVNRSDDDFTFDTSSIKPVGLVSALSAQIDKDASVLSAQGTLSLPYYLSKDDPNTPQSELLTEYWRADASLASGLNDAFKSIGLKLPQADPDVSTAVNYIYPFPKKQADVDVPFLALYPKSGTIKGVVIFQHGITTDRSAALTFGTALADQGYAVMAIDQPLHGVAAFTKEEQQELAGQLLDAASAQNPAITNDEATRTKLINGTFKIGVLQQIKAAPCPALASTDLSDPQQVQAAIGKVLGDPAQCGLMAKKLLSSALSLEHTVANAGSTIPGLAPMIGNERHFGVYSPVPGTTAPIDYDKGVGDSGSMYINLTSFLTSRDNNRESVVDQMNLRASLPGLTLPGTDSTLTIAPNTKVYFAGHSLGTITGAPYVASVNANQIENTIFTGMAPPNAAIPSTSNDIVSASLLTPGGGVVRLLENSPTFAPQILLGLQQNGLEQGDSSLETYFNVLQAAFDTADPINFTDNLAAQTNTKVLLSVINGDQVIPNAADEMVWGIPALMGVFPPSVTGLPATVSVDSFNAPLAGGLPLSMEVNPDKALDEKNCLVRYDEGTHGTPTSAMPTATFQGMVTDTLTLFGAGICPGEAP